MGALLLLLLLVAWVELLLAFEAGATNRHLETRPLNNLAIPSHRLALQKTVPMTTMLPRHHTLPHMNRTMPDLSALRCIRLGLLAVTGKQRAIVELDSMYHSQASLLASFDSSTVQTSFYS